jgi:2-polyprenyl-3-methyl-5-hydroxy-6-metoxy-1,4-benzoquinol methylase
MAETNTLTPDVYTRWRESSLGRITEALESKLVFELAGPLSGKRVLDVGTGDGVYALEAALRQAHAVGVDASPAMLSAASQRARERRIHVEFREGQAQQLPFENECFDVVLAVTVLCFVPDPKQAVREVSRVLVPGGRLVLGELGRWSTWAASRRLRAWLGNRTWKAAQFWTRKELAALAREAGLSLEKGRGAIFYPPWGLASQAMAPVDSWLGQLHFPGAAFLAVAARKPSPKTMAG